MEEAYELQEKTLNFAIDNLDSSSPVITRRKSKLALLLRKLGGQNNLIKAEKLIREALASDESNFGLNHHLVAARKAILSSILKDIGSQENLIEAKRLREEALETDIINFGPDSHIVAKRQINLALLLLELPETDFNTLKRIKKLGSYPIWD